jgi:hypothetical protein
MAKSVGMTAEEQFAKLRLKEKEALKEREAAGRARSDKVDKLRALRLAKEAADKEAAASAPAKAPARKRALKAAAS